MDFDFHIDLSEVKENIDSAEVLAIYFPLLRKTLLIDARSNEIDGPLVKVVPMASSPEERFQSLNRLRPRFPRPESITIIPWPKYVGSLQRLGIWERIMERLSTSDHPYLVHDSHKALNQLINLEQKEISNALLGERYMSLWERKGQA